MDSSMEDTCSKNIKLPFKCRMLCVSLIGGSLVLAFIFLIYYLGYISIETAIWVSMGIFITLAIYESILLSLITVNMIKRLNNN